MHTCRPQKRFKTIWICYMLDVFGGYKGYDSSSLSCSNDVNEGLMVFWRFRGYREF